MDVKPADAKVSKLEQVILYLVKITIICIEVNFFLSYFVFLYSCATKLAYVHDVVGFQAIIFVRPLNPGAQGNCLFCPTRSVANV